ncbi:bidirectional sugar transporter SWEET6b-like, partial [Phalaenopsis equestris]|uniref:bidirectional sugar transporter SWEET6b-like n=1 Tax=Phalaenopsis equestris TaxID=78828 RepID=UPI0009E466AB
MWSHTARTVVGIIGNGISFTLFLSPVPTFLEIYRKKSVLQFSPIPYLTALANCMLWLFYGLPVVHPDSILVSTINGAGVLVVTVYLTVFFFYSPEEIRRMMMKILAGELVFMAMVVTLVLTAARTHDVRSLVVGILTIILCVCMYASPLSVMKLVIKTKSVKYMPFWLSFICFLNSTCWTSYAAIEIDI